jgi:N-acetyl sugar amidotransferase
MISYCTRCVMPETKPDLTFDAGGVCSACRNFERRTEIDWAARRVELAKILDRYHAKTGTNYDCLIPVSGGKDSTFQVVSMLELGANPLCVTAMTDDLSDYGRYNIENIKKLGVDYIEVSTNPVIRRRINRLALEQVGDVSWPEHTTIFTVPVRIAAQLGIPLIVWGENPQDEYGGPAQAAESSALTRSWLQEFGGLLGLRVSDLIGQAGIEAHHLIQYTYPTDEELARSGITGVFLGYYLPWDGFNNAAVAKKHGFQSYPEPVEGSLVDYENLDNHQTGIHDYFKFLKYGFGRVTDQACLHVRRGRMSRLEAMKIVAERDGKFPALYLGKRLEDILAEFEMDVEEFVGICDRFTNKKLFQTDNRGAIIKDTTCSLIKVNSDNEVF